MKRVIVLLVVVALLAYAVLVVGAAILFTFALHLDFAKALYFTVTSVTSIGYSDISLAASVPVWRSRTTARGTTMPAQAPSPWTKRKPISQPMEGDRAEPTPPIATSSRPR